MARDFFAAGGSCQDFLLLILHACAAMKFFFQSTKPEIVQCFAARMKQHIVSSFSSLLESPLSPAAANLLFTNHEGGTGFGICDPTLAEHVYETFDSDQPLAKHFLIATQRWLQSEQRGRHFIRQHESLATEYPWFKIFPTSSRNILTDDAVRIACQITLDVQSSVTNCRNPSKSQTSQDYRDLDHSLLCATCAGPWWNDRHEKVIAAMMVASH